MFLLLLSSVSTVILADDDEQLAKSASVEDLRYGVALYYFYQQDYFDALSELMVGLKVEDVPNHGDNVELLMGGISLSYGMDQRAEEIFQRILSQSPEGRDRDVAWFYLAKLAYQRGENSRAADALSRIDEHLPESLDQQSRFVEASLALRRGEVAQAGEYASGIDEESIWLPYYFYNLGAIETASGNWQAGVQAFQNLQQLPLESDEAKSLRDCAYTAAGFANINGGQYEAAIEDFLKARLESPLVERALLGFGWAAAEQGDYQRALSPWQVLSKHSILSASVQESLLAIPFAYEKLDVPGTALEEYLRAVTIFEQERSKLKAAIANFESEPLSEIFSIYKDLGPDWFSGVDLLPVNDRMPYLSHLVARHEFQLSIKDLKDLLRLRDYLNNSQRRLENLRFVLNHQQQVWKETADSTNLEKYRAQYKQMQLQQQSLGRLLAEAKQNQDGLTIIDKADAKLWRQVDHARGLLASLENAGEDVSAESAQLRLYQGLLNWQASENYSQRVWTLNRAYSDLTLSMEEVRLRLETIETIIAKHDDSHFAPRIEDLSVNFGIQQQQVDQQILAAEQAIKALAVAELKKQTARLDQYIGQAKLSIARLYDSGTMNAPVDSEVLP